MTASSNTNLPPGLSSSPPPVPNVLVSFPAQHILLVTLNRSKQLNAIPRPQHLALDELWTWYDEEPSLRCAVITGTGRAFCAGQDLKEWNENNKAANTDVPPRNEKPSSRMPSGGFGGLSNRGGKKPVIAAVNGICFGGGMEMAINCDMVIATEKATFGLPEVTIGVIALAGALPRLMRSVGRQRASEMALGGKSYSAAEMLSWGLVNEVTKDGEDVVAAALKWAGRIAGNSPDSVIVSREGLKMGWESVGPQQGTDIINQGWYARIEKGENYVEGVKSFNERRKPAWKNSKL
ncbi:enoyl-hydratase [Xylaria bambusicola]|uniref:enoyl-hydratase n=1 Tax=Xylaria bambusicola TaxID=326684 RepID=UPI0020073940|nr:enoyl-hydratase [Xylaria bambusicola]KAI0508791.1 enoyl-hydratase [Xylaria bambusicola]